jgi:hypothetical protein
MLERYRETGVRSEGQTGAFPVVTLDVKRET